MDCHIKYGKAFTLIKFGLPDRTLNTMITKYNGFGDAGFIDKRAQNHGKVCDNFDADLLAFLKARRQIFLPVPIKMIRKEALRLAGPKNKKFTASDTWLYNFLKRNHLSLRKRTRQIQILKEDLITNVDKYFTKLEKLKKDYQKEGILYINMDEVNLPFDLGKDYTIDQKGIDQVPIVTHSKSRETCTIAPCVTSDGDIILPFIIFKYKYSGKKETEREAPKKHESWTFTTIPCVTRFSDTGFNKLKYMNEWIKALVKKLKLRNEKRKVVLILDSASCHLPVKAPNDSNIDIVFILGACTAFLQPLDLTLNKILKTRISDLYLEWLDGQQKNIIKAMNNEKSDRITDAGSLRAPDLKDIRQWFCQSVNSLCPQKIRESFELAGISKGFGPDVHINKRLLKNFEDLIKKFEQSNVEPDPYLDNVEQTLKFAMAQENFVVCNEEVQEGEETIHLAVATGPEKSEEDDGIMEIESIR